MEVNNTKICPIGNLFCLKDGSNVHNCLGNECAWYDIKIKECCINSLAAYIN